MHDVGKGKLFILPPLELLPFGRPAVAGLHTDAVYTNMYNNNDNRLDLLHLVMAQSVIPTGSPLTFSRQLLILLQ